jgi:hypothetical protein
MPNRKQQIQKLFTQKQGGLILKMQRFYNGQVSIERALMHYGIAPFTQRNRNCIEMASEVKWFREWAEKIPWFEVRECPTIKNGSDSKSWKLVLLADNLPQVEEVAS